MAYTRTMNGKVPQVLQELHFDETPTQGSLNPVTSGGVAEGIDAAKDEMQDKIDEVTLDPSAVALGNVHLLDEVTSFAADAKILVDSETNGPGAMPKDVLLTKTAQNALTTSAADEVYYLCNGQKKSVLGSDLATDADMPLVNLLGQTSGGGKKPVKVQIPFIFKRESNVANVLWNEIDKKSVPIFETQNGYIASYSTNVGNFTASDSYRSCKVSAVVGQAFRIAGSGTSTARLWFTFDASNKIVRRADANVNTTDNPVIVTIESGEVGIGFNTAYNASLYRRIELVSTPDSLEKVAEYFYGEMGKSKDSVIKLGDYTGNSNPQIKVVLNSKFNIRFDVLLPKNMYNRNTGFGFFKLVGYNVTAQTNVTRLTQHTKTFTDNGVTKTSYLPYWLGGIAFRGGSSSTFYQNHNIGSVAFTIKYKGGESSATIENDGTSLVITEGSTTHTFTLANYDTMDALYTDLILLTNFDFEFGVLENMVPSDLAICNEAKLVSEFKNPVEQGGSDVVYTDKAKMFVHYQNDERLHNVEVFSNGDGKIYACVDGDFFESTVELKDNDEETLVFYGANGFKFYNIEVCTNSELDAEILDAGVQEKKCVSSQNPLGIILEGHGISDLRSSEVDTDGMDSSVDRLQFTFDLLKERGYVNVSIDEIAKWKNGQIKLPKKFFGLMFDDWRFDNFTDLHKRSVFGKNAVRASLAVVTSADQPITINGQSITIEKAVEIGKNVGFTCYSHTKNHSNLNHVKYSELEALLTESIYDADIKNVHSDAIVYPYGASTAYVYEVAKWLGCSVCVDVATNYIQKHRNDMCLFRIEVGNRQDTDYLLTYIL